VVGRRHLDRQADLYSAYCIFSFAKKESAKSSFFINPYHHRYCYGTGTSVVGSDVNVYKTFSFLDLIFNSLRYRNETCLVLCYSYVTVIESKLKTVAFSNKMKITKTKRYEKNFLVREKNEKLLNKL
jgi:hypothetical protein